jgi:hypothetical protein
MKSWNLILVLVFFGLKIKIENAELGHVLGLDSILMEHGHNMNYKDNHYGIPLMKDWKDVYEYVVG